MSRKCRLRSYKNIGDDGKWAADRIETLERQIDKNNPLLDEAARHIEQLEAENAKLKAEWGEPVAWEWKRTHLAGGYTRQVTISEQQAIEWAADSSNLHEKDTVTPLYARKDKS